MTRASSVCLLSVAVLAVACVPPRRAGVGGECEVNSECDTPLVCRLGHCRNECATSADCAAGLSCVLDLQDLGACQLPPETSCSAQSDCPAGLVCRFMQCTNDCETDRDCPGGARCEMDAEGLACVDHSGAPCTFDEECDPIATGERCLSGRCRRECFADRDCRNDFWCNAGRCTPPPRFDVGAASVDGGADAGILDAPNVDAPSMYTCGTGPLTGATRIAMGPGHGCALTDDGAQHLFCWGENSEGAQGTATPTNCAQEVPLMGRTVSRMVANVRATCLLLDTGVVECMGGNSYGTLGRGMLGGMSITLGPVTGLLATDLFGGSEAERFFAIDTGGALRGWGENSYGTLGDGTTDHQIVPVAATDFVGATLLGNGGVACGAVGGDVSCRGYPFDGALGRFGGTALPTPIAIAVGRRFSCAAELGQVVCWGQNIVGQLGDGTTSTMREMRMPTLPLPANVSSLCAGDIHACALLTNDELWCWGSRQAFAPDDTLPDATPIPERAATGVDAAACGGLGTCIVVDGAVRCVGAYAHVHGLGYRGPVAGFTDVRR